jgi:shikimate dehydrogenase
MTDRYAVIGNPVAHSKSPQIHAAFARQAGDAIEFSRLFAPLDGFDAAVKQFIADGGKGLSVTLPFKLEAIQLATRISSRAERAGAANFLRFDGSGIHADNTDGEGLVRDLTQNLAFSLTGAHVLLVGAGGAARGVIAPLLDAMPASLSIVNRTAAKALALVHEFAPAAGQPTLTGGGYADIESRGYDIVINATSASIADAAPPLPEHIFFPGSVAYDLMYAERPTPFMQFAAQHGAVRTADGLGMLVEQAAEAFFLWRGTRPETASVLKALRPPA